MPAVGQTLERGDARCDAGTEIHLPREIGVIAAWHVAEHVPLPGEPDRIGVVRIGRFAGECENVARFHAIPDRLPFVVDETCERRVLHDDARGRSFRGKSG